MARPTVAGLPPDQRHARPPGPKWRSAARTAWLAGPHDAQQAVAEFPDRGDRRRSGVALAAVRAPRRSAPGRPQPAPAANQGVRHDVFLTPSMGEVCPRGAGLGEPLRLSPGWNCGQHSHTAGSNVLPAAVDARRVGCRSLLTILCLARRCPHRESLGLSLQGADHHSSRSSDCRLYSVLTIADGVADAVGLLRRPLQVEPLLALARRRTGLDEFGDTSFVDPLRRFLVCCMDEASLSLVGRMATRWDVVRFLTNLLRFRDAERRDPGDPAAADRTADLHHRPAAERRHLPPPAAAGGPGQSGPARLADNLSVSARRAARTGCADSARGAAVSCLRAAGT